MFCLSTTDHHALKKKNICRAPLNVDMAVYQTDTDMCSLAAASE